MLHPDRLPARVAAWPFASRRAFEQAQLRLERTGPKDFSQFPRLTQRRGPPSTRDHTKVLLDAFETTEAAERRISLQALVHALWFPQGQRGASPDRASLSDVLECRAAELLECAGATVRLAPDAQGSAPGARASAYRFQVTYLPPDLLVAAASSKHGFAPPVDRPQLMPDSLQHALDERVAEVHQHVKAAVPFETLWLTLMRRLTRADELETLFQDPAAPFGGGRATLCAALMAASARRILVRCLFGPGSIRARVGRIKALGSAEQETVKAMNALVKGRIVGDPWRLQEEYAGLFPRFDGELKDVSQLRRHDPVERAMGRGVALGETRMLALGIEASRKSDAFGCLFWQYVRLRCLFYQYLTQHHGTEGFSEFQRYFERIKEFRSPLLGLRAVVQASVALTSRCLGLESMEARLSPSDGVQQYRVDLCDVVAGARTNQEVNEVGVVVHFPRTFQDRKGPPHCSPEDSTFPFRFGRYFQKRRVEAEHLKNALLDCPELLRVLRGVDLCTEETAVPGFILFPLLMGLRRLSKRAASRGKDVRPLRVSLHAGEDFGRLIQGLRLMHEPLEFGLLERDDRVGHGFALAFDPAAWSERHACVAQRREDRLEDLLWELSACGQGRLAMGPGRQPLIEREALDLALKIYGDTPLIRGLGIPGLIDARARRFTAAGLKVLGFPDRVRTVSTDIDRLNMLHMTSMAVYRRSQEVELVVCHPSEEAAIRSAQSMIRKAYASLGITIEALPSSNLMTQAIGGIEAHPVFELVNDKLPLDERVGVTLSDDDPVTLATSLPDEMAYVHAALLRQRFSSHAATQWVRQRCDVGWGARFTQPIGHGWPR